MRKFKYILSVLFAVCFMQNAFGVVLGPISPTYDITCNAGYYSAAGTIICAATCPKGYYCPGGVFSKEKTDDAGLTICEGGHTKTKPGNHRVNRVQDLVGMVTRYPVVVELIFCIRGLQPLPVLIIYLLRQTSVLYIQRGQVRMVMG